MARKKTGRLIHWGCWELPRDRDSHCLSGRSNKDPVSQAMAREKGTAQEYIAAYDADP